MLFSEFCLVRINFSDADFWLIRVGSKEKVGMPVRSFHEERIGIKILRTDTMHPDYLFYVFLHLHGQSYFEIFCAQGTLELVYIKVSQVKNIKFKIGSD